MSFENKLLARNICNVISFLTSIGVIVAVIVIQIVRGGKFGPPPLWLVPVVIWNLVFLATSRYLTDPYR